MSAMLDHKTELTVSDLRKDTVGLQLGYWPIRTKVNGRKVNYLIVKDKRGFVLVTARAFSFLGYANTLSEITTLFNSQLDEGQTILL